MSDRKYEIEESTNNCRYEIEESTNSASNIKYEIWESTNNASNSKYEIWESTNSVSNNDNNIINPSISRSTTESGNNSPLGRVADDNDDLDGGPPNLEELLRLDPYLAKYKSTFINRYKRVKSILDEIEKDEGGLNQFSTSYVTYGMHADNDGSVVCVEWCPKASRLFLFGEFNDWKIDEFEFKKMEFGKWQLRIPSLPGGRCRIQHNSIVKLLVHYEDGTIRDKLCPWTTYATRDANNVTFDQRFWNPEHYHVFTKPRPPKPNRLRIYECHIGIASNEEVIATYQNFEQNVLPRIVRLGYNAIQIMAIAEHALYSSFGYQVTSFFAPSSRYGTPTDLKRLVDAIHGQGLIVLLDLAHSHASPNTCDGINQFDGSEACFFHDGPRGYHDLWRSRLFDYSKREVLRYLLSNLRWWIEEFNFDGFRFDSVTSILYRDHGIGRCFTGHYDEYFGENVDEEGAVYLCLANYVLHKFYPDFVTSIAEDVSGMPALCRPLEEGGFGFDYRMAMAVSDKWIEILKLDSDYDWKMGDIVWTLRNRRHGEKYVVYAECHDQALVGDQTIAFRLMGDRMYFNMMATQSIDIKIARGMALHKMIRLITYALGGESYLNFIGNEFGHPEWLDFPREGNNESFFYARRQFHLVDDHRLLYKFLESFDRDINYLEKTFGWLDSPQAFIIRVHEDDKTIAFERAGLTFVFNFHPEKSFPDYLVGVRKKGLYSIVMDSDNEIYKGYNRIDHSVKYPSASQNHDNCEHAISLYIPCRTAIVLKGTSKKI